MSALGAGCGVGEALVGLIGEDSVVKDGIAERATYPWTPRRCAHVAADKDTMVGKPGSLKTWITSGIFEKSSIAHFWVGDGLHGRLHGVNGEDCVEISLS